MSFRSLALFISNDELQRFLGGRENLGFNEFPCQASEIVRTPDLATVNIVEPVAEGPKLVVIIHLEIRNVGKRFRLLELILNLDALLGTIIMKDLDIDFDFSDLHFLSLFLSRPSIHTNPRGIIAIERISIV